MWVDFSENGLWCSLSIDQEQQKSMSNVCKCPVSSHGHFIKQLFVQSCTTGQWILSDVHLPLGYWGKRWRTGIHSNFKYVAQEFLNWRKNICNAFCVGPTDILFNKDIGAKWCIISEPLGGYSQLYRHTLAVTDSI